MSARNIVFVALAAILIAVGTWWALRPVPALTPVSPSAGSSSLTASLSQTPTATHDRSAAPGMSAAPAVPVISGQMPQASPVARPAVRSAAPQNDAPASAALAAASAAPQNRDAMIDLDKVHHMITDYHTLMGENPVGTNAEIMQALMGANRNQATLGPPEGQTLNSKGELTDRWGTPYFFHQLSRDTMEIRSAGPDKILGTADDVIIK